MTKTKDVRGSAQYAIPLLFDKDTVYIKENIRIEEFVDGITGIFKTEYVWDETQMSYPEYIEQMQLKSNEMEDIINFLLISTDNINGGNW